MRTCKAKSCRKRFEPVGSTLQPVCSPPCAIEHTKYLREKKEKEEGKTRRRRIKKMKREIMTLSDHKKELQVLVNRYVRIRDKDSNCISCDRPLVGKFDAGHFYSQGGYPSVRFDLVNIWGQCVYCNRDLHGNLLPYRTRLIKKIGKKEYNALEQRARASNKQTIPEIILMKEEYKEKLRVIKLKQS